MGCREGNQVFLGRGLAGLAMARSLIARVGVGEIRREIKTDRRGVGRQYRGPMVR